MVKIIGATVHRPEGLENIEKGGTFNCIKYAQSQGKEIINLWDKYVTI